MHTSGLDFARATSQQLLDLLGIDLRTHPPILPLRFLGLGRLGLTLLGAVPLENLAEERWHGVVAQQLTTCA